MTSFFVIRLVPLFDKSRPILKCIDLIINRFLFCFNHLFSRLLMISGTIVPMDFMPYLCILSTRTIKLNVLVFYIEIR